MLDIAGEIMWFAAFVTPLITLPLVWRDKSLTPVGRILLGVLLAFILSVILIALAMAIASRDGFGRE